MPSNVDRGRHARASRLHLLSFAVTLIILTGTAFSPASMDARRQASSPTMGRANSYDDAWESAWVNHGRVLVSAGGKTDGFVLQIGDSITHSRAYSAWAVDGQGKTADDAALLSWVRASTWSGTQTDTANKNGFYLAGADTTAQRGMTASGGLSTSELVNGCCNPGVSMNAESNPATARALLASSTYLANVHIDTVVAAFNDAQFAVLMLGTNDPAISTNLNDLRTIVSKLEAANILPILSTVPPRNDGQSAQLTLAFNDGVRALAQSHSLPLIDYYTEIVARRPGSTWINTLISSDGVHPTADRAGFTVESDPYADGGNASTHTTGSALDNVGYLLRSWLTVQKLKEVKRYVIDGVLPGTNAVQNGGFANGTTGWQTFATPDASYLVTNVTGGVLQFYRTPPSGTMNQAVVFQNTGLALAADAPVGASFSLGNSSSVRKRVSVLLHDGDFSDLSVCTFWLPPNSPLRSYAMTSHTTRAWLNATVSFYAATAGSDSGFYRLDNVVVQPATASVTDETQCSDPLAAAPTIGDLAGPSLLVNGGFGSGSLAPWSVFGAITWQLASGVFEFVRPPGTPAGVILQPTWQALLAGSLVTADFNLGNSSSVRKRVTALLHDFDFSDLAACTFWLEPNQSLGPHAMRAYTTKAWTNATISIYAATVGGDPWIRLDGVQLRQIPSSATVGTECLEPGAETDDYVEGRSNRREQSATHADTGASLLLARAPSVAAPPASIPEPPTTLARQHGPNEADQWLAYGFTRGEPHLAPTGSAIWFASVTTSASLTQIEPFVVSPPDEALFSFQSRSSSEAARRAVEIKLEGGQWQPLIEVQASADWTQVEIDLNGYAGETVRLRFVYSLPNEAEASGDSWEIRVLE